MERRQHFRKRITETHQLILKMGACVEESLEKALTAVKTRNSDLANQVIEGDSQIDALQMEIEEACTVIIATEQPVATDLREIMVAIKIASDLERIGDHARHLARSLEQISPSFFAQTLPIIEDMTRKGIAMVHDSLSAYVEHDAEKAQSVASRDDEIDALHHSLYDKVITMMRSDSNLLEQGTTLIFLNRFLERLGDHVTNMCEWIVYAATGEHVELNKKAP